MKITIKPSEIIERCIWNEYHRFALKGKFSKSEIEAIIEKDEEFEISEDMAFVIGLLNKIYTPHLIYKLNQTLKCDLENRSTIADKKMQINRELLEYSANSFMNNFPNNFKSVDAEFNYEYNQLQDKIDIFNYNLYQLETTNHKDAQLVKCKQVKKLINEIFN